MTWLPLLLLVSCSQNTTINNKASLCPHGNVLRIGVDEQLTEDSEARIQEATYLSELSTILSRTSGCPVNIEPISTDQLGIQGLSHATWDFAFLGPSLTVLALMDESNYIALRSLGNKADSRSAILVNTKSEIQSYGKLSNKRLGLLPKGSILGYYLPLYNSYGARPAAIIYGESYQDLLSMLKSGKLDAISWDTQIAPRPEGTRIAVLDPHFLPESALVMKTDYIKLDYQTMLGQLDENAFQLPPFLRYAAGSSPRLLTYQHMFKVVREVQRWDHDIGSRLNASSNRKEQQ